jgi:hypothetical protein
MKNESSEILAFITMCNIVLILCVGISGALIRNEIREIKHHQQNTQYYSIPELDCYCQIHHIGKRDIFINVEGDTVAIINRK